MSSDYENSKPPLLTREEADRAVEMFKKHFLCRVDALAYLNSKGNPCPLNVGGMPDQFLLSHLLSWGLKPQPVGRGFCRGKPDGWEAKGPFRLGTYSPSPEGLTPFACMDFDGGGEHTAPLADPLAAALTVAGILEAKGIPTYLERSKGGKGWHLWVFFSGMVSAALVRRVLLALIPRRLPLADGKFANVRKSEGVELFPKQDRHEYMGNQVWLPMWSGAKYPNNWFHRPGDGGELEPYLPESFDTASVATLEAIAATLPEPKPSKKNKHRAASMAACRSGGTGRPTPERLVADALAKYPHARNDGGLYLATQARDNLYSADEAEAMGADYVRQCPDKGHSYTFAEFKASVRSAFSRPPREPWGFAPPASSNPFVGQAWGGNDGASPSSSNGEDAGPTSPPNANPATNSNPPPAPPRILITPYEGAVTEQVTNALATAPDLFQRQGSLVRPFVLEQDCGRRFASETSKPSKNAKPQVFQPAGLTVLRPAKPAFVRLRITEECRLERDTGEELVHANPPAWLAPGVMEKPGAIRVVHGVLPGPTLDEKGRLISTPGYDAATGWFLGSDLPGLSLPERPTQADATAAAAVLTDLVGDFPWQGDADKTRWLCLLLTACCRHLISLTPFGLITANVAGSGKTYLARLISIIAHGLDTPILMSWPEGSEYMPRGDEIRKRLASLLHESASFVLLDNLPRGQAFGSAEVDAFLTSNAYTDRKLGVNDGQRAGGVNRCLLVGTGNAVQPYGDTADRTLIVRLLCNHPNPRARGGETFRIKDLERHTLQHRPQYLGAALTIWRAWLLAGSPRPEGQPWGTFDE